MPLTQTKSAKPADNKSFLNDVFRRLRFALSINDDSAIDIFSLVEYKMSKDYLHSLMKKDNEPGFIPMRGKILALFLDGLIIKRRVKETRSEQASTQECRDDSLSNNDILRKIKIAMSYQQEDMLKNLQLAKFNVGKSELTALFRNKEHRNYKQCNNQLLRNFLQGMVLRHRPEATRK